MESYIGYATDAQIRQSATSGGIGTSLVKWLFDKKIVETSISFSFNNNTLEYIPQIIHSFEEYQICGSVYQEIDLVSFVKSHLCDIRGGFVCFALPCQAKAIRYIVERSRHLAIVIGLTCSSQQTIEATHFLLQYNNIKPQSVQHIKYRGDGWPSGVKIKMKDGTSYFYKNNNSCWTSIFHSRLFMRKKCFKCKDTLNIKSDIALADPWLDEYLNNEKIGQTICTCFSEKGAKYLRQCQLDGYISLREIPWEKVELSQKYTICRKQSYSNSPNIVNIFFLIIQNKLYRYCILQLKMFTIHCRCKNIFESYLMRKLLHKNSKV